MSRSSASVIKHEWRKLQRRWGEDRRLDEMTETQIWSLVRILVLLVNLRDMRTPTPTHARALQRRLDWSQGVLMPRLQRLESAGWVRTEVGVCVIAGKRCRVQSYIITSAGEAVAVVMSQYLRKLVEIRPHKHRQV